MIKSKMNLVMTRLLCMFIITKVIKMHNKRKLKAYFGHTCFSIFNACYYYQNGLSDGLEDVPVTITSESSDHSRIAAFLYVNMLIKHI